MTQFARLRYPRLAGFWGAPHFRRAAHAISSSPETAVIFRAGRGRGDVVLLRRIEGVDGRIALRDVTVRYGRRLALETVSGEFVAGSMTAVVGANGAGKSTLLAAIAGEVPLAGGVVNCAAR